MSGIVYTYLPFMVLPLYARLTRLDPALTEAAADLGAPPRAVFLRVILPLSLPGVAAGVGLVFIPAIGEYVIPALLGGPQAQLIGQVLWQEFSLFPANRPPNRLGGRPRRQWRCGCWSCWSRCRAWQRLDGAGNT